MTNLKFLSFCFLILLFQACGDDLQPEQDHVHNHDVTNILHRSCGLDAHMESLMSDPVKEAAFKERAKKFQTLSSGVKVRALCSSPTVLPMAVHYQGVPSPDDACLIELAQSQIAILNNDYQGTNGDITNWTNDAASSFPNVTFGEACIEFCIANKNHPSGYNLNDGDLAVTINQTTGDFNSDWAGYINIFVQFDTGVLGYSPLGGSGNGDGVVVDASAFGSGSGCGQVSPNSPYDLGRTLTHELGHYLFLDHIWGNGCNVDDDVADTPESNEPYYGCPSVGASSCGSTDLHMNYMDYTNDACMYMFSNGQAGRMEDYTNANLNNVINNAANVCDADGGGDGGDGGDGGGEDTCEAPADGTSEVLSATSVKLDWADQSDAILYKVAYKVEGTTGWTKMNTNVSEIILSGLQENTNYLYRIKTKCPTGWTGWSIAKTFSTSGGGDGGDGGGDGVCENPSDITVENTSDTSVELSWTQVPDAIKYRIKYKLPGSTWITETSTVPAFSLENLEANATYSYRIRTRCPDGWTSWSAISTFDTSGDNGGGDGCTDVGFNLTLDDYGSETSWELATDTDEVLETDGPYSDNANGTQISESFCLEEGCYTIYVDDAYGDGICCEYGNGSFEVVDSAGNQVGYSDGNFGTYDQIDFCVENGNVNFKDQDHDAKLAGLQSKVKKN